MNEDCDKNSYRGKEAKDHAQVEVFALAGLRDLPIHDDNDHCHHVLSCHEKRGELKDISLLFLILH